MEYLIILVAHLRWVKEVNIAQFKKSSKYYNRKVNAPEGVFDSKKEYKYFLHLKWLESQGKIKNLRRQVVFELVPKTDKFGPVRYKADFVFEDNKGVTHVIDVKSDFTRKMAGYIVKKKLLYWRHGIKIEEV